CATAGESIAFTLGAEEFAAEASVVRLMIVKPVIVCGLPLSKTWKSLFVRFPRACPWASRTTTGTSTSFTNDRITGGGCCNCCPMRQGTMSKVKEEQKIAARSPGLKRISLPSYL